MSNNNELWFAQLSGIIFTHFVARMKTLLTTAQFKKTKFTTDNSEITPTHLPAVYLEEVFPIEEGSTLDNTSINAVTETIQITVYHNGQMRDVKSLMTNCVLAMKQMRFGVATMPIFTTNHDMKTGVARFRRIVGESDTF